jgi:small conductance mechanosensitive channel
MLHNALGMFNDLENIVGTKVDTKFSFDKFLSQSFKYFDLLLGSILIILLGYFAARFFKKCIKKLGKQTHLNELFINFASKFVFYITIIVFSISALNNLGIQTTSIATVLGALSVGIGLAFQNSLSNFAAGLLIILLRPFKLNDLIEVGDVAGKVIGIDTLMIQIKTRDNKIITIPNSKLTSDIIINHTAEAKRRIKYFIQIEDIFNVIKALEILRVLAEKEEGFIHEEEILVYLADAFEKDKESGICVEAWIKTADLGKVNAEFKRKIIDQFNQEKIKISFPRSNVLI